MGEEQPNDNNAAPAATTTTTEEKGFDDFLNYLKTSPPSDEGEQDNNVSTKSVAMAIPLNNNATDIETGTKEKKKNNKPSMRHLSSAASSIFAERDGHTLEFNNILLSTKINKKKPTKQILDGLSGTFPPKTLTAIMGPSGSGKTSLLKILTGRMGGSSKLDLSGSIKLDHKTVDPTNINIRKQIAYVEQDVTIPATCTPREAIAFSARLRLDKNLSDDDIDTVVTDILDNLGLTHVADTLIGGGILMSGGLSGGEKKRVQCGVELVTNPEIIICDEPTSGLDSYSAQSLMDLLKKIAEAGACVIVTIHQPPPPVVRKMDNLLLLLGGRMLYQGPMGRRVEEIFAEKGFPKPNDYNIADWILEVAQTNPIKELENMGFFDDETKKRKVDLAASNNNNKSAISIGTNHSNTTTTVTEHVGLAIQTRLLFDRELKKLYRDKFSFVIKVVSNLIFGLLFGFIFFKVGKSSYVEYPEVMASFGAISNLLISTMFGVAQSSLMEFPKDRPVFLREYSTNHYSVGPYFLAKFTLECVTVLIQTLVQLLAAFFLMGFRMNFLLLLALSFMLAIASTSIGIFIGSCIENPDA
ncbi:hypothetical protein ACHAXR_005154, partial [Thalassiosira sp. AJA248-18]